MDKHKIRYVSLILTFILFSQLRLIHDLYPKYNKVNQVNNIKYAVVFSMNEDMMYGFYAPITALSWIRLGFTPIIIATNSTNNYIIDKLRELNCIVYISHEVNYFDTNINKHINMNSINNAQISRLFASTLLHNDTYLLTSDIDMIPLMAKYYYSYDEKYQINIYNSDQDFLNKEEILICYIGAKVKIWKELMNIRNDDNIEDSMIKSLIDNNITLTWSTDQKLIYNNIVNNWMPLYGNNTVEWANKQKWRLNRGKTWRKYDVEHTDCHCLRPAYTDENWNKLYNDLLVYIFSDDKLQWITNYKNEFCEKMNVCY
jgi:hypothetical protein